MKTFFTSDQHFLHANIIRYCQRPFSSVEEMDSAMIQRWNSVVGPGDCVYHLGDFGLGTVPALREIISKLNGHIVLVRGSHDGTRTRCEKLGFKAVIDKMVDFDDGTVASHEPLDIVDEKLLLCGHVHGLWVARGNRINVGVDVWDYAPVTIEQMLSDERVKEERRLWTKWNFGGEHV